MRLIDRDKITEQEICSYLGIRYSSCCSDIVDMLNDQPVISTEEYCEWQDAHEVMDNIEFKVQCEFNPLKCGAVPNNFAHHNFKFCPFCGRKIKWISR